MLPTFMSRKRELADILAPLNTLVNDLIAFSDQQELERADNAQKIDILKARNATILKEVVQAESTAAKLKNLLGE